MDKRKVSRQSLIEMAAKVGVDEPAAFVDRNLDELRDAVAAVPTPRVPPSREELAALRENWHLEVVAVARREILAAADDA